MAFVCVPGACSGQCTSTWVGISKKRPRLPHKRAGTETISNPVRRDGVQFVGTMSAVKSFQTDALSQEKSMNEWKEYISEVYFDLEVALGHNDSVRGALTKRTIADVGLSSYSGTPHGTRRTRASIQRDLIERHVFVFPVSGVFECHQNGKEVIATPGSMYVVNGAEPYAVDMYNDAKMLALSLPCDVTRSLFKSIDDKCCTITKAEPILTATFVEFVQAALSAESAADATWLRSVCCDLLDKVMSPVFSHEFGSSPLEEARFKLLDKARETIGKNLHKEEFCIADAAAACRVSKRHLQDVFQRAGTTFTSELTEARLAKAAGELASQSRGAKRIGQIAYDCGFKSQSYFSSLYKSRFGKSPRE